MRPVVTDTLRPKKLVDFNMGLLYSIYVYFVIRNRERRKECLVGTD
jgi:hypothetical protein